MVARRMLLAAPLALPTLTRGTAAQDPWPTRAVTVLLGFPPGGLTDFAARAVAERMSRELGQPVVVENRPGAATSLAATAVARARPDGYTLLWGSSVLAVSPALQPNLTPREPLRELAPIGMTLRLALVLHINASVPAHSVAELIALARAHPGTLKFGSSGVGSLNHLCLELFRARAGIEVLHVPYRGGAPAAIDLRAGRIDAMFSAAQEALPTLQEGATRGLAVSSAKRIPRLPELPPVADTLPGFDVVIWQGLFAPAGTPAPVLARAGAALRAATEDPELLARFAAQGATLITSDDEALRQTLTEDIAMWGRFIREANIRVE